MGGQIQYNIESICSTLDAAYRLYPDSVHEAADACFCIACLGGVKRLLIVGAEDGFPEFQGETVHAEGMNIRLCPLDINNSAGIRKWFPFTNPVSCAGRDISIGLGDRLGTASPGHLSLIRHTDVFPVLAQQSARELKFTGRSFEEVLAAAVWAVFQEDYRNGYGADGDHLKTIVEVQQALDCGFSMITLDCSEYIEGAELSDKEVKVQYAQIGFDERQRWERIYLDRTIELDTGHTMRFSEDVLGRIVLTYRRAIRFAADMYRQCITQCPRPVDFEVSLDEVSRPTAPQAHWFIASELMNAGVRVSSLAPRFCGEFQKGIDYRGDTRRFAEEFEIHAGIARLLGYRLSVHSGSDKYAVFPIIGEKSGGRFHIKTSGTNWLEVLRLAAMKAPTLFREILGFALTRFEEARKAYAVSADAAKVPDPKSLADCELCALLDNEDARQVLHITYGYVLQEKDGQGAYRFRDDIYTMLDLYADEYGRLVHDLIKKHLELLGAVVLRKGVCIFNYTVK
jgi:hypothetical protein